MNKKNSKALIVFIKNPIKGKVKTRLAKDIGDEKALEIYLKCLEITFNELNNLKNIDILIFFSDYLDDKISLNYLSYIQTGDDLGIRMNNAFKQIFQNNYKKAIIIGSDLPEIKSTIIEDAFNVLNNDDVVIGPSFDGGYYLLGMKKLNEDIFKDIQWSSSKVLGSTIEKLTNVGLNFKLLKLQRDLDDFEDLKYFMKTLDIISF